MWFKNMHKYINCIHIFGELTFIVKEIFFELFKTQRFLCSIQLQTSLSTKPLPPCSVQFMFYAVNEKSDKNDSDLTDGKAIRLLKDYPIMHNCSNSHSSTQ